MKKTKLIALTMVVAIMMIGAGYAAWTDTLNFEQEVNTGHLDVHFVDLNNEEVNLIDPHMGALSDYSVEADNDGQNQWDNAKLTINNVYPGAKYNIQVLMKNNSTMPVKFASITSPWGPWEDLGLSSSRLDIAILNANGDVVATQYIGHAWDLPTEEIPVGGYVRYYVTFVTPDDIAEDSTLETNLSATFKQFNQ
ncbi:MAG: hypothetical protein K0R54_4683 [Clostridiaceae bacterium]|jgi:hypothetical protein|nr:hypothetical protein [Clostridiaceae bacterium]